MEYVVFVDSARRYTDCSEGVLRLLDHSRDEILNKTIDDISYNVTEVPALFAQYLKTGTQEGEYVLRRKDGAPVPIRYRAFTFGDGCKAAVWEPIRDWREPYLAALLEFNPAKAKQKIDIAVAAIDQARQSKGPLSQTTGEQQAIADARSALMALLRNG